MIKLCEVQGKYRPCNHVAAFVVTNGRNNDRREVCGQHLPSAIRSMIVGRLDAVIVRILGGAS